MTQINYTRNIAGLIVFSFIAAFISQTMTDFADIIAVSVALIVAYKNNEIADFFKGFHRPVLWIIWLVIILTGLIINLGFFNIQVWINFIEFKWIITFLSFIYLVNKVIEPKAFIKNISMPVLILNLISLILFFYMSEAARHMGLVHRASGVLNATMAFSHNIGPVFSLFTVLMFVNWVYYNRNEKILIMLVALTSGALTLLTYTRGVWLGSLVAIIFCLSIWSARRAVQFLLIVLLLGAVLFFTNQNINNRILNKTASETYSNDSRLALWKANWRMIQDYPVLGVGFGENKNHLRKYYDDMGYSADTIISHAHNQYLQTWAGTGTLGFICYLAFLYLIFRTTWSGYKIASSEDKALFLGLISALLCFTIGALTEVNFSISKNRFFFILLAGVAIGISNRMITENKNSFRN
ncbi:MAG: O-antigen ligase family protein [Bdellovibrionota bacterium]